MQEVHCSLHIEKYSFNRNNGKYFCLQEGGRLHTGAFIEQ